MSKVIVVLLFVFLISMSTSSLATWVIYDTVGSLTQFQVSVKDQEKIFSHKWQIWEQVQGKEYTYKATANGGSSFWNVCKPINTCNTSCTDADYDNDTCPCLFCTCDPDHTATTVQSIVQNIIREFGY